MLISSASSADQALYASTGALAQQRLRYRRLLRLHLLCCLCISISMPMRASWKLSSKRLTCRLKAMLQTICMLQLQASSQTDWLWVRTTVKPWEATMHRHLLELSACASFLRANAYLRNPLDSTTELNERNLQSDNYIPILTAGPSRFVPTRTTTLFSNVILTLPLLHQTLDPPDMAEALLPRNAVVALRHLRLVRVARMLVPFLQRADEQVERRSHIVMRRFLILIVLPLLLFELRDRKLCTPLLLMLLLLLLLLACERGPCGRAGLCRGAASACSAADAVAVGH